MKRIPWMIAWYLALAAITYRASADGLSLEKGRYRGPVLVFDLTAEQIQVINHFRNCHLKNSREMNVYTPYVFTLTSGQEQILKAKTGFSPHYFEVYETYRGFNEAGPRWNLALRFSENQIEIPLDLLLSDRDANDAHAMQGWKAFNPCFPKLDIK